MLLKKTLMLILLIINGSYLTAQTDSSDFFKNPLPGSYIMQDGKVIPNPNDNAMVERGSGFTDSGTAADEIRLSWSLLPPDTLYYLWYDVYFCAADDTNLIPIWTGSQYDDINNGFEVSEWLNGRTVYNYFYIKRTPMKYYRVGIIGIDKDGRRGVMLCKTYQSY